MNFDYRGKLRERQNYIIIAIVCLIFVFIMPFFNSSVGIALVLPTTVGGWVIYITSKLSIGIIGILIFHCFMQQAKINIKDHPKYLEANEILSRCGYFNTIKPIGPTEWQKNEYNKKGALIGISSIISAFGLTQAILAFDWIVMLSYAVIVAFNILFGLVQMARAEWYWTDMYYNYAKMVEREMALAEKEST